MFKFYYVCPRCGRVYKRYIPRRKAKCAFCSTVWKTRKAKGTRAAFSWGATLAAILALAAICYLVGRGVGGFNSTDRSVFKRNAEIVETSEKVESVESAENAESTANGGDAETESTANAENAAAE